MSVAPEDIVKYKLFDVAVMLMDDNIREFLNMYIAPCSEIEFLTVYMELHKEKYGIDFVI